ncbi:hypothetical protein GGX14DRAFT_390247 [Mycena pura]|uniref:Uncharacterized protein n=1 Tax=Mycena pura TaxID=153505 RepID=A0AAD6YGE0_9AGAR|nr:hypothetical protein GGX14DRAFT_390247 [Mycena pura]
MGQTKRQKSASGRQLNPSKGQKNTNENLADAAAKKQQNKDKAARAASRKAKRSSNDAQAEALRDRTNDSGESSLSVDERIARLTARLEASEAKNARLIRKNKKLRHETVASADTSGIDPIAKPRGRFNIQEAIGLAEDRAEFTKLQPRGNVTSEQISNTLPRAVKSSRAQPLGSAALPASALPETSATDPPTFVQSRPVMHPNWATSKHAPIIDEDFRLAPIVDGDFRCAGSAATCSFVVDEGQPRQTRVEPEYVEISLEGTSQASSVHVVPALFPQMPSSEQLAQLLDFQHVLQAVVHATAVEGKLDFGLSWSQQDPMTIGKISRVVEERCNYLCAQRFPRHWATQAMLQRYLNSVRGYKSGKENPSSGVSRRRALTTAVGRREAEAQLSRRNPHVVSSPPDDQEQMDVDRQSDSAVDNPDPPAQSLFDDEEEDEEEAGDVTGDPRGCADDRSGSEDDDDELEVASD